MHHEASRHENVWMLNHTASHHRSRRLSYSFYVVRLMKHPTVYHPQQQKSHCLHEDLAPTLDNRILLTAVHTNTAHNDTQGWRLVRLWVNLALHLSTDKVSGEH